MSCLLTLRDLCVFAGVAPLLTRFVFFDRTPACLRFRRSSERGAMANKAGFCEGDGERPVERISLACQGLRGPHRLLRGARSTQTGESPPAQISHR